MRNVKNLKNGKGQKSSLNNQTISVLLSIYTCIAYWLPAPDTTALVTLRDKPQGENDSMPQVQVWSGEKLLADRVLRRGCNVYNLSRKSGAGHDSIGHT